MGISGRIARFFLESRLTPLIALIALLLGPQYATVAVSVALLLQALLFGDGGLITLGANGVAVIDDAGERHLPAHVVKAVDTTAAGDTFIGGLSAGLVEGMAMDEAVALGQRASALCVTRHGAQPSIPYRREIA